MGKISINMISVADSIKGQGVGSAYLEQVELVKSGASDLFDIHINDYMHTHDINHFHTLNPDLFIRKVFKNSINIAYCHFLPDTLKGSVKLPHVLMKLYGKYVLSFYRHADRLVVVNPSFKKELVKYGVRVDRIYYIPNYVSKETFYKKSEDEIDEIRKKYGFKKSDFIVLDAGQVQTRKGVLDFVEVAKSCPDMQFVWAGGFSFGKITDGYVQLKKILENHPDNVHFLGVIPREEMNDIYNMSDVLFMPSYNELFPMTILEAVNCEVPVILRNLDLYKDILFTYYAKGNNNSEFKDLLVRTKSNPDFYKVLSNNSIRISKYYSKEHVLSLWKQFYLDTYEDKYR